MLLNSLDCLYMSNVTDCVCPTAAIAKKNLPFNGNTVNSSNTNAMRYSQLVRGQGPNSGTTRYISADLNAFGYYSGGPGGSCAPPRNYF